MPWRELAGKAALETALAGACFVLAAIVAATAVDLASLPKSLGILTAPVATAAAAWVYQVAGPRLGGSLAGLSPLSGFKGHASSADRAASGAANPADRAASGAANPADRAASGAANPADRAAPGAANPADRAAAGPGIPSTRAPVPWGQAALIVLASSVAALVGSMLVGWLVQWISGAPVQEQARILELFARADPWELSLLGVGVIVLAPISEEWLFRGLLFERLRSWGPLWLAFALSALLFASVHANLSGLWTYLWLAGCFSFALRRSGRLSCAILVHAANNAATFVLLATGWSS